MTGWNYLLPIDIIVDVIYPNVTLQEDKDRQNILLIR